MPTGKIKWFNQQIGAGFIRSDEGENVFLRCRAVDRRNRTTIRPGQCVNFEIAKNLRSIAQTAARVKPF